MKFCKDCVHYVNSGTLGGIYDRCSHPLVTWNDPVSGEVEQPYASKMREDNAKFASLIPLAPCGPEANLFAYNPPKKPWYKKWLKI